MIDRYSSEAMRWLWSAQNKTARWLDVELAVCDALERHGRIPAGSAAAIRQGARFDLARIAELEKETRHDVMAFVKNVAENLGPEGRFVHYGVTSYDIVDTALAMLLRDAAGEILARLEELIAVLRGLAAKHRGTVMIGRTHGIHAEPITFGFKVAGWIDELERSVERLARARVAVAAGKISGAVGTHANVTAEIEAEVCGSLGLSAARFSTQIVARDRITELMAALAILSASLERFATEIRNLARTEIREVQERFAAGQKGSSAMPHKRNPWNSETVCGLARVVRGYLIPCIENMATWHERDLTNSSVERIALPDATILVEWMVAKFTGIVTGLVVFPENMRRNLQQMGGLVFSEQLMMALIVKGMSREAAYSVAQRNAASAWDGADFEQSVRGDSEVNANLTEAEIDAVFDLDHHLRNLDGTFDALGIGCAA
ncbi:MAG: adenylosuccinate lyase [Armatimonadetes bacterium]|nr:adenylosuccinate lyase [Armatimonadota bacterium]MDE2206182.1 adenylosuccinate lyase [Armatimonadota bacterium]